LVELVTRAYDATQPGALYRLKLTYARAFERMTRESIGTPRARECYELVRRLGELERIARKAADDRFDPTGL
jgi:hypothetical protein